MSPFESFLFLDSDVVVWGDFVSDMQISEYDFIHNTPHEEYTSEIYKGQYFDYERIFDFIPYFDWTRCHFFNSGVFFSKRDIFQIEDFIYLYELWKKDNSLMFAPPQSIINILLYGCSKRYRIKESKIQEVVAVKSFEKLRTEYLIKDGMPQVKNALAIHWAGEKPSLRNSKIVFSDPMFFFRKLHLKYISSIWRFCPIFYFYYEEFAAVIDVYYKGSIKNYILSKLHIDGSFWKK